MSDLVLAVAMMRSAEDTINAISATLSSRAT